MNLKISIITPSFNQGEFLEQTIDSVLSQSYENIEYIIIDGGSTDESVDIIKKYARHLKYWTSEPDNGQSDAINKGYKLCTGQVINWLNSDDYYQPETLKTVSEIFSDCEAKVVCGKGRVFNERGTVKLNAGSTVFLDSVEKSFAYGRIDQPETFWRHDVFKKVMPLSLWLHYCMDKEIWMKFLLLFGQEGVVHVDDVLVNFRLHESSKSYQFHERFLNERNMLFCKFLVRNGASVAADKILDIVDCELNEGYDWYLDADNDFVQGALVEFLLLIADEKYNNSDFKTFRMLLKLIQKECLSPQSLTTYKKLIIRSRIPSRILNSLKHLRS